MRLHGAGFDAGPPYQERHSHVELERETLPFDQAKLAEMVAVIGRVDDVRVVQLAQIFQLLVNLLTSGVKNKIPARRWRKAN